MTINYKLTIIIVNVYHVEYSTALRYHSNFCGKKTVSSANVITMNLNGHDSK